MTPFVESPAHPHARRARALLDSVSAALREVPHVIDRAGVGDRLARAMKAIYTNLDTRLVAPAHHTALVTAAAALAEARGLLEGDRARRGHPQLDRACAMLDEAAAALLLAERQVADVQLARRHELRGGLPDVPAPARPMRGSVGVPQLHAMERGPIAPRIELGPDVPLIVDKNAPAPAPPLPRDIAELRAAAAKARDGARAEKDAAPDEDAGASALAALVAEPSEREMLRRVARDCLEDVAILSTLRSPIPTESWLDQAPFEQRLLDNLDAFVSLGEIALPEITMFHAEAPAPDAARAFGVAFTLGCIAGKDAVDVAISVLLTSAPLERPGFEAGFVLAPSPEIDRALAELLGADEVDLCRLAVDVLATRGAVPFAPLAALMERGDEPLTAAVARALGRAGPARDAVDLLIHLTDGERSDAVFMAAVESLLRRGHGSARELLRATLARGEGATLGRGTEAARLLALSGRADDLDVLVSFARRAVSAVVARALGRFGHVGAVPALAELCSSKEDGVAPAALQALEHITGVALPDGAAWDAWWAKTGSRLDPRVKLRAGRPFTLDVVIAELAARGTAPVLRDEIALEIVLAAGIPTRFFAGDWVQRQHEQIADLRARLPSLPAGSWSFHGATAATR